MDKRLNLLIETENSNKKIEYLKKKYQGKEWNQNFNSYL